MEQIYKKSRGFKVLKSSIYLLIFNLITTDHKKNKKLMLSVAKNKMIH